MGFCEDIETAAADRSREKERRRCAGIARFAIQFAETGEAKATLEAVAMAIENDAL